MAYYLPFYSACATLVGKDLYTNMTPVTISSLAIIVFAAIIHASFQLSVSVLTLLSGHSIGKKTAQRKIFRMSNSFVIGVLTTTLLLISSVSYFLSLLIHHVTSAEQLVAAIVSGMMFGLGIAIWAFYYRRQPGTSLWIPRGFADYLNKRTKKTKNSVESFALGLTSVIAEIIFIIAPIVTASLAGVVTYIIISMLPLLIIIVLVGGGHNISSLQKWRENHKRFIQFASGGSLLILAAFMFVDRVIGVISYGGSLW